LKQKRFDFVPPRVGVASSHLDEGLRETSVEQQVARQVGVSASTDVQHADERAPEALPESNSVGRKVIGCDLADVGGGSQNQ